MPTFKSCGILLYRTSTDSTDVVVSQQIEQKKGSKKDNLHVEVLLLRNNRGALDLPKGHMEVGETEIETASLCVILT